MPYKDKERTRDYKKEYIEYKKWRIKHLAQGLCRNCNQKASTGFNLCEKHRIMTNLNHQRTRIDRKKSGYCECGSLVPLGYTQCVKCAYKQNLAGKKYYSRNRESRLAYQNKRTQEFIKAGGCSICGKPLMDNEIGTQCRWCLTTRNIPVKRLRGAIQYATDD